MLSTCEEMLAAFGQRDRPSGTALAIGLASEALDLYGSGKTKKALRVLEHALQTHPECVLALGMKGVFLGRAGDYRGAISCLTRATDLHPDEAWAWEYLAEVYHLAGRGHEALDVYERLLESVPG